MTPPARAEDVSRRFGEVLAVDGVDLEVGRNEVVGLLGANGAGKTTLIRVLLGLIPPTSGRVELFGEAPSRRSRERLGYVPQGLGLYEDLTVRENLAFHMAAYGGRPTALPQDLAGVGDELVGSLSLGVARRVAFAAALAHGPDLLVLDEPTSGVDPLGRARLWETIRRAAEAGSGVLVTTHHMEEAEHCDRLVVMASGRVALAGTPGEVVAGATAAEVRAARWEEAFSALDAAGLPVALVGRTLRVPGTTPRLVEEVLLGRGVRAEVREVPATLEERFVSLSTAGGEG
ncbi:MAG: ABC transporter ATP-binding protein [Actinobacteria bacterium]|nr:ABC transporter ATP-binding protein [Actinomycetota bacterium]